MLPVVTSFVSALYRGSNGSARWIAAKRPVVWIPVPCPVRVDGHRAWSAEGLAASPSESRPRHRPVEVTGMAIYSLHVSNVSRAAGSSSVASVSYITSRRMRDERTGVTSYGYGRRERVEATGTMLPSGAPAAYNDPETLFNAVEAAEKRSDARTAKKIMVALPRELTPQDRRRAIEDFVAVNLCAKGYAATWAIHTDPDGRNPHAHIIVANRRIDPNTGQWAAKSRSVFALDGNGQRIPIIDPDTGQQKLGARGRRMWKRVTVSNNPLDSKDFLERLRADWAEQCNLLLPQGTRIDHRSNEARGIEAVPTIHEGYAARAIEQRGGESLRCAINRRIRTLNEQIRAGLAQIRNISEAIRNLLTELRNPQTTTPAPMPGEPAFPPPEAKPAPRPEPQPAKETAARRKDEPAPMKSASDLLNRLDATLNENMAERENTAKKRGRKRRARR